MDQHADEVREQVPCAPTELDYLYNEIDKLYHAYARGCGLSDCGATVSTPDRFDRDPPFSTHIRDPPVSPGS